MGVLYTIFKNFFVSLKLFLSKKGRKEEKKEAKKERRKVQKLERFLRVCLPSEYTFYEVNLDDPWKESGPGKR